MGVTRCTEPGCGRSTGKNNARCRKHRKFANREVAEPSTVSPDLESDGVTQAEEEFRLRLAKGDYRELFGEALNVVIQQAAAEPGLGDEIGILRVVLARILIEERDPAQLAESIARVASVAIQAARAQRAISGEVADRLQVALFAELTRADFGVKKEVEA